MKKTLFIVLVMLSITGFSQTFVEGSFGVSASIRPVINGTIGIQTKNFETFVNIANTQASFCEGINISKFLFYFGYCVEQTRIEKVSSTSHSFVGGIKMRYYSKIAFDIRISKQNIFILIGFTNKK